MMKIKRVVKKVLVIGVATVASSLFADTETVNGYTWTFSVANGAARIGAIDDFGDDARAVDPVPTGTLEIPAVLGGVPVKAIAPHILGWEVNNLTKLVVPETVETIEYCAFYSSSIKVFVLPSSLKTIGSQAFDCNNDLETLVIPENVEVFEGGLGQCRELRSLYFKGNAPANCEGLGARLSMTTYVVPGSTGWKEPGSAELPEQWKDRPIKA